MHEYYDKRDIELYQAIMIVHTYIIQTDIVQ